MQPQNETKETEEGQSDTQIAMRQAPELVKFEGEIYEQC